MFNLRIVLFLAVGFILLFCNNKIVPNRFEISEIEPVRVIGMDKGTDNNVMLSVIREKDSEESGSSDKEGSESATKQEVVSVNGSNFEKTVRALQNYKSKKLFRAHVKSIIIGDEIARDGLMNVVDFIVRDVELRPNVQIYISRDSLANDFLIKEAKSTEKIQDVIKNLNKNLDSFCIDKERTLIEIMPSFIEEGKSDLIPSLISSSENIYNKEYTIKSSSEEENESILEFAGYAVVKDAKLIDYLTIPESRGANFVKNKIVSTVIPVGDDIGNEAVLELIKSDTKLNFVFDEDALLRIEINNINKINIVQFDMDKDIMNSELIKHLESNASYIIKNEIQMAINKSRDLDADFLGLEASLKLKHPYKYRKIKYNISEILKTVPIEVNVESEIERTYDILTLNKEKQ